MKFLTLNSSLTLFVAAAAAAATLKFNPSSVLFGSDFNFLVLVNCKFVYTTTKENVPDLIF